MKRKIKNFLKRSHFILYKMGTRVRIHIVPVHYYSPIPDIIELKRTKEIWAKQSELPGITVDLDEQVDNLKSICEPYKEEYRGNIVYKEAVSKDFGPGFSYIDAQALHGVIRNYKPNTIIEIGSGISTRCSLVALKNNLSETGKSFSMICIEPYPSSRISSLKDIELIPQKVQTVSFDVFERLVENDLLFVDSSHTVKPGGDVNYLILEVLPRLKPGVIVPFHDIYLPYDYQRNLLQTFFCWCETSLLRAFLINNHKVKIIFCLSHLHYERKNALEEVFEEYDPEYDSNGLRDERYKPFEKSPQHFPSSIYFKILND